MLASLRHLESLINYFQGIFNIKIAGIICWPCHCCHCSDFSLMVGMCCMQRGEMRCMVLLLLGWCWRELNLAWTWSFPALAIKSNTWSKLSTEVIPASCCKGSKYFFPKEKLLSYLVQCGWLGTENQVWSRELRLWWFGLSLCTSTWASSPCTTVVMFCSWWLDCVVASQCVLWLPEGILNGVCFAPECTRLTSPVPVR